MPYAETVPLPVLARKAVRPSRVITSQQGDPWRSGTDAESANVRSPRIAYEDAAPAPAAPPKASDTTSRPRDVKSKPKGVWPLETLTVGPSAYPLSATS